MFFCVNCWFLYGMVKLMLFVLGCLLVVWLFWVVLNNYFGVNLVEVLIWLLGDWSLCFLVLVLVVIFLCEFIGWLVLVCLWCMIGLFVFFYVCLYLLVYVWFDMGFEGVEIVVDVVKCLFILVGMVLWVLLVVLVVILFNWVIWILGVWCW